MPEDPTQLLKNTSIVQTMYYEKSGSGPAVVLLHGFPESGSLWNNITGTLDTGNTLIIPDLPGSGKSPLPGSMTLPEMADELKQVLDKEGINKAIFAGHSMGGYTALAFADKYPDMVTGLSLVHSTPLPDDEGKKTVRRKTIELLQKGGKAIFINQMIPNLFSETFKQKHPETVKKRIEESMKMPAESMINFYNAMLLRNDTTHVLRNALFPVQWVLGIEDNIIPYKKILQECYNSGINFVEAYKDCGHMSMFEQPGKLAADMASFTSYCYTYPHG